MMPGRDLDSSRHSVVVRKTAQEFPRGCGAALVALPAAVPFAWGWGLGRVAVHRRHHADPTSARHGVRRGQIDISARLIWLFERFGWAADVRWPSEQRLARITAKK
jgi:hypothetical protein